MIGKRKTGEREEKEMKGKRKTREKKEKRKKEESFSGIRFHSLTRSKICVSVIPSRMTTGEEAFLTGLILRS